MRSNRAVITIIGLVMAVCVMAGCASTGHQPPSSLQGVARETIRKDPRNTEYWVEYGRASIYSKEPREAEQAFRKAIELDRKYLPAYKHLGLLLMTEKKHKDAQQIYLNAFKVDEKDSELWTAYGYCLADMGESSKALEAFKRSVEVNTNSVSVVSAHLGASGLMEKMGDEAGAKREYEEAVKISPEVEKIVNKKPYPSAETSPQTAQRKKKEFRVDLWLDKEDATYRIGDEVKISFKANMACRVTLLMGGNDRPGKVLYPNAYQKDNTIKQDIVYRVPEDGKRYVLRIKGPAGENVIRLVAVLTEAAQGSGNDPKVESQKTIEILDKKL